MLLPLPSLILLCDCPTPMEFPHLESFLGGQLGAKSSVKDEFQDTKSLKYLVALCLHLFSVAIIGCLRLGYWWLWRLGR